MRTANCIRFNAARGFVGGATVKIVLNAASRLMFQCRTRLCGWCKKGIKTSEDKWFGFNAARGFVGGATHRLQPLSP